MEFERKSHRHIDVTPLVDVVFNLLLFFMITYNVAADPAIRIRLPDSTTADAVSEEPLVITVTREGETYVGHEPVALEEIPPLLRRKMDESREASVKIKADQEVPVGLLVRVVDAVRVSGCQAFSIVTEKKPPIR